MFNEETLKRTLQSLSRLHRIAFAASCCERLLPNYDAFVILEGWGDPSLLRHALDTIWEALRGTPPSQETIHQLMEAIMTVLPDSEEYSSLFTTPAQEAGAAIINTLQVCLDGSVERAARVSRNATETIRQYVLATNDALLGDYRVWTPEQVEEARMHGRQHTPATQAAAWEEQTRFEAWAQQAPLMLAELEKQQYDLEALKMRPRLDARLLEELRFSSSRMGIQPFERGLIKVRPETENR